MFNSQTKIGRPKQFYKIEQRFSEIDTENLWVTRKNWKHVEKKNCIRDCLQYLWRVSKVNFYWHCNFKFLVI